MPLTHNSLPRALATAPATRRLLMRSAAGGSTGNGNQKQHKQPTTAHHQPEPIRPNPYMPGKGGQSHQATSFHPSPSSPRPTPSPSPSGKLPYVLDAIPESWYRRNAPVVGN